MFKLTDEDEVPSSISFGYLKSRRVALITQGGRTVLVPRSVLVAAISGWSSTHACEDPYCEEHGEIV